MNWLVALFSSWTSIILASSFRPQPSNPKPIPTVFKMSDSTGLGEPPNFEGTPDRIKRFIWAPCDNRPDEIFVDEVSFLDREPVGRETIFEKPKTILRNLKPAAGSPSKNAACH